MARHMDRSDLGLTSPTFEFVKNAFNAQNSSLSDLTDAVCECFFVLVANISEFQTRRADEMYNQNNHGINSINFEIQQGSVPPLGLDMICELRELMLAIGATDHFGTSHFALVRGQYGLLVELGVSPTVKLPVWHVCSVEEANKFYTEPRKFTLMISEAQARLGVKRLTSDHISDDSLIYVGALTKPCSLSGVTVVDYEFKAPTDINSRRTPWNTGNQFMQICEKVSEWLPSVEASASISTTLTPLATNLQLNATLNPRARETPGSPGSSGTNHLRVYYKASLEPVFVYEAESGLVSEQNMYTIVRAVDACHSSEARVSAVPQDGFSLDHEEPVINVCRQLFSASQPIVYNGTIGGIVLEDVVLDWGLTRVAETPKRLPQWAQLDKLRNRMGLAVFSIIKRQDCSLNCRRNLVVSVPFLGRQLGFLRRIAPSTQDLLLTFTPNSHCPVLAMCRTVRYRARTDPRACKGDTWGVYEVLESATKFCWSNVGDNDETAASQL